MLFRGRAFLLLLASIFTVRPAIAAAQACHGQHDSAESNDGLTARGYAIVGRDATATPIGNYEGFGLELIGTLGRLQASGSLAFYRLDHAQTVTTGLGDAALALRGILIRTQENPFTLMAGVHAMVPTGSVYANLGMGMTMLGPEIQASKRWSNVSLFAAATYMHMVTINADAKGMENMLMPTVDPHYMSELAMVGGGTLSFARNWSLKFSTLWLVPLMVDGATARGAITPGLGWNLSRLRFALDVEITVYGAPNVLRGFFSVGYSIL